MIESLNHIALEGEFFTGARSHSNKKNKQFTKTGQTR